MTLPTTLKRLVWASSALLVAFMCWLGGWVYGQDNGIKQGLDMYHKQCYNIGGYVINQEDGTAVMCQPLTELPKEERKYFNDRA